MKTVRNPSNVRLSRPFWVTMIQQRVMFCLSVGTQTVDLYYKSRKCISMILKKLHHISNLHTMLHWFYWLQRLLLHFRFIMLKLLFSTKGVVLETDIPPKKPQEEIHQTSFFWMFVQNFRQVELFPCGSWAALLTRQKGSWVFYDVLKINQTKNTRY